MKDFPAFMKNQANKVDAKSQYTPGIEGYVFDGADGSQMAFWTYKENASSENHTHDFDEYITVVQGRYTLHIGAYKESCFRAPHRYPSYPLLEPSCLFHP